MTKSMTGYGRATSSSPLGELVIEVHAVNRRTLEMSVQASKEFLPFDLEMRKIISSKLHRGQVTLRITREFGNMPAGDALKNSLHHLKKQWEEAAASVGLTGDLTLSFLADQMVEMPILDFDEEGVKKALISGLNAALDKMIEMKKSEGQALSSDITDHLRQLEKDLAIAELSAKETPERLAERLAKKLEELSLHYYDRI
ncbi:MAG: hypothetical protein P0S94_02680, partial [Simkaniaceae bacterium]|nr:hypothetical protein [Simkaniaceae bacterium]